jgi:hypothetical protein
MVVDKPDFCRQKKSLNFNKIQTYRYSSKSKSNNKLTLLKINELKKMSRRTRFPIDRLSNKRLKRSQIQT